MSGAYFGGVGYVEDENIYDSIYIRRDTLDLAGQLISFDQNTQEIGVISAGPTGYVLSSDGTEPTGLKWVPQTGDIIAAGVPAAQTGSSRLTIVDTGPSTTLAIATTGVGAGSVGGPAEIPVITYSDTGQILAVGTAAAVNAGSSGAESATSGLTIGPSSVALALSGAVAGVYGNATTVPQITIDARGRILAAVNQAITFPAVPDQLASVATRNWGAGSGRALGTADNTGAGDGTTIVGSQSSAYGSATRAASNSSSYGYLVRSVAPNNHFFGHNIGNITMNVGATGNIAVSSNTLLALTTGQNNAVFGTGAGSALTSGSGNIFAGVGAGPLCNTGDGNTVAGTTAAAALTTSPNNAIFGLGAAATLSIGTGRNLIAGHLANVGTNNTTRAVALGAQTLVSTDAITAGFNSQANGVGSAVYGVGASSGGINSNAFGFATAAGAGTGRTVIGDNITNNINNSALLGNAAGVNYLVRSSGFFRSARQLSVVAGQSVGDAFQVINSPGPTQIQILSARFDNFNTTDGASSVDFGTSRLFLGQLLDAGSSFDVQASLEGNVSVNSQWRINVLWSAPGVALDARVCGASEQTIAGVPTGNCLSVSTTVNVAPASTGRNYITFTLENLQGGGTFTITNFRAGITRYN